MERTVNVRIEPVPTSPSGGRGRPGPLRETTRETLLELRDRRGAAVACALERCNNVRTHRAFPGLQPWSDPTLRELITADHLTVLRVEPWRARANQRHRRSALCNRRTPCDLPLVLVDVAKLILRKPIR